MNAKPSLCSRLVGIGISAPYASQLSRGERTPDYPLAMKIHESLGIQLGLLKGNGIELPTLQAAQ